MERENMTNLLEEVTGKRADDREADADPVMNVKEAARFLGIPPTTLRYYAKRGLVPNFRLGRHWKFRFSELNAWARAKTEKPQR